MEEKKDFFEALLGALKLLNHWQVFIIIICGLGFYMIAKFDLINKYLKIKTEIKILTEEDIMAIELEEVKKQIVESRLKNIEVAAHQAVEVLKNCIGANYYVIHNSGGDLTLTDKWFLVILRSTSYNIQSDYEKPHPMTDGYKWLNKLGRDRLYYVIHNIEKQKELVTIEKDYLKLNDVKSTCVFLVRNDKSRYHMASFNFDSINPDIDNEELKKIAMGFKRAILANI